jgi:RNA polymerase sigma-70 factor (ECF subfamily)
MADGFTGWVSALVHRFRGKLAAVARKEGLSSEDALDVAMVPDDAAGLLVVLTRNRRRRHDRARRHEPLRDLPTDDLPVDDLIAAAEAHAAAVGCACHLSEVQRRVVTLRLLDDVPGEEVATLFGSEAGREGPDRAGAVTAEGAAVHDRERTRLAPKPGARAATWCRPRARTP